MRKEGYYWVKRNSNDDWIIAYWNNDCWYCHMDDSSYNDDIYKDHDFEQIDEKKIIR
jgi:hypothetical protein